jgi:hypothetical protein
MIRCTIELLPGGRETGKRIIGLVEIANVGGDLLHGDYVVVLKKTPPFAGALRAAWRKGGFDPTAADQEVLAGRVEGHHRTKRGVYDLLYRGLLACGLDKR